ncbi:MAG: tyrosine--tRNA ligase [bacterium (Candidatus Ratteibacteria) CG_4_9_14_3_um_filter_41_21]|uniref:Tyrosine--tRNA ligase n=1 Tax=bacterium (Candidatus Ratteibacteria) CG_4_9_14_3_um_filter_41_21 TaxID=2014289 RepID=A0A2M7YEQ5_9BACT|nr:MAG: tyrosine--tRNA ligase [bacterium (Candidatus Ratteibacteria) CG_4_9_14_3_um_filter_41_21]
MIGDPTGRIETRPLLSPEEIERNLQTYQEQAMIGDPTGRIETRPLLSPEEIERNLQTYQEQAGKLLDLRKTEFVRNSSWLEKLNLKEVIKLTSSFTAAQMLERKDFRQRYQDGLSPSLQEFIYPLMQGYDSVALKSDVEVGATEQKFNLLAGRTVQEAFGMKKQVVITMPILEGTDGKRKMSKSFHNYIGINEKPEEIYGKLMSIPDALMEKYFSLLTEFSGEEISKLLKQPFLAKKRLASSIVQTYCGKKEAEKAEKHFETIFQKKKIPLKIPVFRLKKEEVKKGKIWIIRLLDLARLVSSHNEARRLLRQKAISLDGEIITSPDLEIKIKEGSVIKVGKRRFVKVKVI